MATYSPYSTCTCLIYAPVYYMNTVINGSLMYITQFCTVAYTLRRGIGVKTLKTAALRCGHYNLIWQKMYITPLVTACNDGQRWHSAVWRCHRLLWFEKASSAELSLCFNVWFPFASACRHLSMCGWAAEKQSPPCISNLCSVFPHSIMLVVVLHCLKVKIHDSLWEFTVG